MYSLISAFYAAERRGIDPPGIKDSLSREAKATSQDHNYGKVILQAKRAGASWDFSTSNVQPEDVQAFTCYQAEREAKEQQRQQQPKPQQKQMARSCKPRGLEL